MFFSKNRVLKNGFTLAEILITLGIIGVISAITIPQLQANVRKQQLRTKFLKTYSMLQQTFKTMEANDVPLDSNTYLFGQNGFANKALILPRTVCGSKCLRLTPLYSRDCS